MRDKKGYYINQLSKISIMKRGVWHICYNLFFKPFPTFIFRKWRLFVLKMFGASIAKDANVYSSARIQSPWNLTMKSNSCIGPHVIIENDAMVTICENATISQYAYLCTSSHDIYHYSHNLIYSPISIGMNAWVAAGAFIGKGVTIGKGAVVGAMAVVVKDVDSMNVVGGNPARFVKLRKIIWDE